MTYETRLAVHMMLAHVGGSMHYVWWSVLLFYSQQYKFMWQVHKGVDKATIAINWDDSAGMDTWLMDWLSGKWRAVFAWIGLA